MTRNLSGVMVTLALLLCVSLPAWADTQFRARKMTRSDVPLGKGQCDIRLRIDNEAEVSVQGDAVSVRTISQHPNSRSRSGSPTRDPPSNVAVAQIPLWNRVMLRM